VTRLKCKLILVRLEIVLTMTHNRCIVCAEHTIGSELFLTHRMELLGDVGHVESYFILLGDADNLDAR
jgi:hypothetical protein